MNTEPSNPLKVELPKPVEEAASNLLNPVTKSAGETFADIWDIVFGGVSILKQKLMYRRQLALEQYKQGLDNKIQAIPDGKLILPDVQVVAGALEDSRYCVEKDELREMFENLIASSMNSDVADTVHPSFSSIIRRMSPYDAQMLTQFKNEDRRPIVNIKFKMDNDGLLPIQNNVISPFISAEEAPQQSRSLECLQALGLISISFERTMVESDKYTSFYSNPIYILHRDTIKNANGQWPSIRGVEIEKGIVILTDFGRQFIDVCLQ